MAAGAEYWTMKRSMQVWARWYEAEGRYRARLANRRGLGDVSGDSRDAFNAAVRDAARKMSPRPEKVHIFYGRKPRILIVR